MNREELIRRLQEIAQQHGDKPLREKDIKAYGLSPYWIRKHFKNVGSALQAAGLQPSKLAKSMATSDDELLDYLDDLQRRLGRRPIYLDIDREGRFSQRIFTGRFGSLENALSQLKERQVSVDEHPDVQPRPLASNILQLVQELQDCEKQARALEQATERITRENQKLQAELIALQTPQRKIVDEELRNDCAELLRNEEYYIDAIRRAGVVLETRLREAIGGPETDAFYGAALVRHALNKDSGKLIISDHPAEQDGVHQLFSGAFAFVRNPPAHKKVEYAEVEAWQVISLIDYLLSLLRQAKPRNRSSKSPSRLPV